MLIYSFVIFSRGHLHAIPSPSRSAQQRLAEMQRDRSCNPARMRFGRFALFTGLGAGIWVVILALAGYMLGKGTREMSYAELVPAGEALIGNNLAWIFMGLALIIAVYAWVHRRVMHGGSH